jgi:hypothetical protein
MSADTTKFLSASLVMTGMIACQQTGAEIDRRRALQYAAPVDWPFLPAELFISTCPLAAPFAAGAAETHAAATRSARVVKDLENIILVNIDWEGEERERILFE